MQQQQEIVTGINKALSQLTILVQPAIHPVLNIQVLEITGAPTGGTFTLTFGGQTTAPLAWDAAASDVAAALNALSSIGGFVLGSIAGSVTVIGGPLPSAHVQIQFGGALAAQLQPIISATSSLTGGTSPAVSVISILQHFLNDNQTAVVWTPNTNYSFNQTILPATQNGHSFRCGVAGTSGASEPVWNCGYLWTIGVHSYSNVGRLRITYDGTVTWQDRNVAPMSLWDMRACAYKGWLLKAELASPQYDFQTGTEKFSRSQVYKNCMEQANRFIPVGVA
jgi:hypothetical protein